MIACLEVRECLLQEKEKGESSSRGKDCWAVVVSWERLECFGRKWRLLWVRRVGVLLSRCQGLPAENDGVLTVGTAAYFFV